MKYVNPDSPHALDIHSEDWAEDPGEDQAGGLDKSESALKQAVRSLKTQPRISQAALGAFALGALSAGACAVGFFAIWRMMIKSLSVRDLKIENLDIGHLRVENNHRKPMEESGGILRFDLGAAPDVFENGLE
jgi:hypothetical protein